MRRALVASLVAAVAWSGALSAQGRRSGVPTSLQPREIVVAKPRVDRLAQWLKAVNQHEPGVEDEMLGDVASWAGDDLRGLWADAKFLAALMRNLKLRRFSIADPRGGDVVVIYPPVLIQRLRAMACAVSGRLASRDCVDIHAYDNLDDGLSRVAVDAAAYRDRTGEDNYFLRRAALLHTDVEILMRPEFLPPATPSSRNLPGPRQIRTDTLDGVSINTREVGIHWEIARTLLDAIQPKDADRPQPGRDPMVRAWYRATAAWMQHVESHDTQHIDRGRELFPIDPDLLFLSGSLHEIYAMPEIQSASHNFTMPSGFSLDIGSTRSELRLAETFFRRAVEHAPDMAEAHLRLGRVLGLQGHHGDAITELRQALMLLDDGELLYDAELFVGAEEEALGRYDAAAQAYEQAASRYPGAQSPLLALSQLARRRGDRAAALAAMNRVYALPPPGDAERQDPWWSYKIAQVRNADALLDELRAPFRRSAQ